MNDAQHASLLIPLAEAALAAAHNGVACPFSIKASFSFPY